MKTLFQTMVFLSLAIVSLSANAGAVAPEIGFDSSALGVGLLMGLIAIISEHRRK